MFGCMQVHLQDDLQRCEHLYVSSFKLNKLNVLKFILFHSLLWKPFDVTEAGVKLWDGFLCFSVCFCCSWWWEDIVFIYFVEWTLSSFFFYLHLCWKNDGLHGDFLFFLLFLFLINAIFEHPLCWMTNNASNFAAFITK